MTPAVPPTETRTDPEQVWTGVRLVLLLAVLSLLSMLGPFTIDTPLPAFSRMGEEFDVTSGQMQAVISVYLLAFGVMSPFHGPISDAVGRRPVMLVGLSVYVAASIGAAFAPSLTVLLVFRVLQGLSAGGGVIVGRTIIRDLFDGARAQQLMSQVMMVFSLAPAIAPLIGGWLIQVNGWATVFWFMAAVGALMVLAVWRLLPETHPPARRQPFGPRSLLRSMAAVSRSWRFQRVAWSAALTFGGQFLYVGSASIIMVELLHRGETEFWIIFGPLILGILLGAWISSRMAGRIEKRRLISFSMAGCLAAAGLNVALAALPATDHLPWVVWGPFFIALATSSAYPSQQLVLLDMFPAHRGSAVSMFTFATLMLNGLVSGLVVPHVTDSMLTVALCSASMIGAGSLLWAWHLVLTRPGRGARAHTV